MMNIVKKIKAAISNNTTYRVGLLQAKAYRALKQHTGQVLSKFDISTIHWAFLGLLNDHPEGLRSNHAALELGVEPPFITEIFSDLKNKDLVSVKSDQTDKRVKIIFLTVKGKAFVKKTEEVLREKTKKLLVGVSAKDILSYLIVLENIIENYKKS